MNHARRKRKQLPYRFDDDDILWEILSRAGLNAQEVRDALLAYSYGVLRTSDCDELWKKFNEAYGDFDWLGDNLRRRDIKEMYHLR